MMKTFYSSSFLTLVLAFLIFLGKGGGPITLQRASSPSFKSIVEPMGPAPETPSKITLEIFNGLDCFACKLFSKNTLPALVQQYSQSDKIDFHLYLIPNDSENHWYGSRGAYCASSYGRFWDFVYALYDSETVTKREVDLIGQGLGFPIVDFRKCLDSDAFDTQIHDDIMRATSRKLIQKPTIFVNDTMLLGNQPLENIDYIIKKFKTRSSKPESLSEETK